MPLSLSFSPSPSLFLFMLPFTTSSHYLHLSTASLIQYTPDVTLPLPVITLPFLCPPLALTTTCYSLLHSPNTCSPFATPFPPFFPFPSSLPLLVVISLTNLHSSKLFRRPVSTSCAVSSCYLFIPPSLRLPSSLPASDFPSSFLFPLFRSPLPHLISLSPSRLIFLFPFHYFCFALFPPCLPLCMSPCRPPSSRKSSLSAR